MGSVRHYVSIARPDHWFKNVFMFLGVVLAYAIDPRHIGGNVVRSVLLAVVATCLVASSNYVLNEILDAPKDRLHPVKKARPAAAGSISLPLAWAEWVLLALIGFGVAAAVNRAFLVTAVALWVAGIFYNVPPIRTKDHAYLDVLSESLNNPIRLLLGWFALIPHQIPPLSLIIAYWMLGAFFMATKRLAEYRHIGPEVAGSYRASFIHYDEQRLLLSIVFYVSACTFFLGIFTVRFGIETILASPLVAGFFVVYLRMGLKADSPAQNPEKLFREPWLMGYLAVCFAAFVFLLFVRMPLLHDIFKVVPHEVPPLWVF